MFFPKSLFIFHRDLRLFDNKGLINCFFSSKQIIPVFILDPRQLENNTYKSENALYFMINSLKELYKELEKYNGRLYLFHGAPDEIVKKIIKNTKIDAVFENRDFTPFAQKREIEIEAVCKKYNVYYKKHNDALINPPEDIFNKKKEPYKVFSAFFKHSKLIPVDKVQNFSKDEKKFYKEKIDFEEDIEFLDKISPETSKYIFKKGGRKEALKILENIPAFADYENQRDFPYIQKTTGLSSHLKFGAISVREFYHYISERLGTEHPLMRQLYWRDFFYHIAFNFPEVFGNAFHSDYNKIMWENNDVLFNKWSKGETGFPIVDAGMRELNQTGFMHNRVRMITASFLVKDLHIDWKWGERYFATKLIDYDPCVNNGNWQWAASTGCDAQPYFRIFNPWRQAERFDNHCEYIKKWIPEFKTLEPTIIHNWHKFYIEYKTKYFSPIVIHEEQAKKAKKMFLDIKKY